MTKHQKVLFLGFFGLSLGTLFLYLRGRESGSFVENGTQARGGVALSAQREHRASEATRAPASVASAPVVHVAKFVPQEIAQREFKTREERLEFLAKKEAYFEGLPKIPVVLNGRTMYLLTTVSAVNLIGSPKSEVTSGLSKEALQFLPQNKGPFILGEQEPTEGSLSIRSGEDGRVYPVVLVDPKNHIVGIVNGDLAFYPTESASLTSFNKDYGLEFIAQAHDGSVTFRVPSGTDVSEVLARLNGDSNVDHNRPIRVDVQAAFASAN